MKKTYRGLLCRKDFLWERYICWQQKWDGTLSSVEFQR